MGRQRRVFFILSLASLAAFGCSTTAAPGAKELVWPASSPRVRLERIIDLRHEPTARRILRGISGGKRTELFRRPYGMAWDGQDLLVADPGGSRVLRIDLRGRLTAANGSFTSPIGIAACSAGIALTDSRTGTVWLLDRRLKDARSLTEGLDRPTGVVCGGDEVFIAETGEHRLLALRLDASGKVMSERSIGGRGDGPGEFNFPTSLALRDGSLWVGDTMNFRVQELDSGTGAFLGQFGHLGDAAGDMPRTKGVAVDSRGHLWISDAFLDQISLYRPDGTLLMALGRSGSARGEFSFPTGIAAADGRVAVADSLNRRIQVFRELAGDLPGVGADDEVMR